MDCELQCYGSNEVNFDTIFFCFISIIGDELSRFYPQRQTKRSRFQYPEVSKLWFFHQNDDEDAQDLNHDAGMNGKHDEMDQHTSIQQPMNNFSFEASVETDSSAGDDVVFDPISFDKGKPLWLSALKLYFLTPTI